MTTDGIDKINDSKWVEGKIAIQQYGLLDRNASEKILVQPKFKPFDVLREYIMVNLKGLPKQGLPPRNLSGQRVFFGARIVEKPSARLLGIRHLYINIYQDPSSYMVIECMPYFSKNSWQSGAWIRKNYWESRGITWELIPKNYEELILTLTQKSHLYHNLQMPYNIKQGPNSNSFIGWLLSNCGLDVSKFLSGFVYWGVNYWRDQPVPPITYVLHENDAGLC
jgi:hypothetical protein